MIKSRLVLIFACITLCTAQLSAMHLFRRIFARSNPYPYVQAVSRLPYKKTIAAGLMSSYILSQKYTAYSIPQLSFLGVDSRMNNAAPTNIVMTEDKQKLTTITIDRPKSQRIILICHGKGDNKNLIHRFAQLFPNDTLYAFDFRGHGESSGSTTSGINEYKDVIAMLQHITAKNTDKKPIFGIGISMGGASLMKAIAHSGIQLNGMVIDSAFADLHDVAERIADTVPVVSWLPRSVQSPIISSYLGGNTKNSTIETYANKITTPTLILHSTDDHLIPYEHAQRINKAITGSKLVTVSNIPHACICSRQPDVYATRANNFFNQHTSSKWFNLI